MTDKSSCSVTLGSDLARGFIKSQGGIHYYPFFSKGETGAVFGVHNDYNIPVGNVQIRVDSNEMIELSTQETPLRYAPKLHSTDLSYIKNNDQIDKEALKKSMDTMMNDVHKISSPYTAVEGAKAEMIIDQIKTGSVLKMRVLGLAVNTAGSTVGEHKIDKTLIDALAKCGI
ncbi:hypothetical protein [Neptuniibacter sp.]|uniref:hypothetical protein n=1 Tax=Neptuniibacter sp. TaxID=1962643 RepID=UPI00263846D2|nr:hypothetical protein [Neptuniibacter sp.]MCP4597807.1 hypothetical protein [Neptuniibacter sp.]